MGGAAKTRNSRGRWQRRPQTQGRAPGEGAGAFGGLAGKTRLRGVTVFRGDSRNPRPHPPPEYRVRGQEGKKSGGRGVNGEGNVRPINGGGFVMRRWILLCAALLGMGGCAVQTVPKTPPKAPLWPTLPLQQVPDFMQGTLYQRVRFSDIEPMKVYGYSLVVNLDNTGDSRAPTFVRDFLIKEMSLRGFGSLVTPQIRQGALPQGTYANVSPEQMLRDKRVAIVEVEGDIPVGAREGQSFDIIVRTLEHNNTKSL